MPTDTRGVLLILALLAFIIAALPVPARGLNLLAIGLALLTGAFILG